MPRHSRQRLRRHLIRGRVSPNDFAAPASVWRNCSDAKPHAHSRRTRSDFPNGRALSACCSDVRRPARPRGKLQLDVLPIKARAPDSLNAGESAADDGYLVSCDRMNRTRRRTLLLAILLGTLLVAWWWPSVEKRASAGAGSLVDAATAVQDESATPPWTASAKAHVEGSAAKERQEPARRQSEPMPLDAPALGFRASPDQRADDLAKLNSASDLAPLLAEFQRRAAQGDADAAARTRDIYDECFGTHGALPPGAALYEMPNWGYAVSQSLPASDPVRATAILAAQARCANILPGGDHQARTLALIKAMRESERLSADLGHLIARIRSTSGWEPDPELRAQRDRSVARALLQEGSPEALMALSQFAFDGTRFSSEAWLLAACAQGYPCADSPFVRQFWCAQFGAGCINPGLEPWMQDQLSAREWRRAQAQRDEILALWRAGNIVAALQPASAGGGR